MFLALKQFKSPIKVFVKKKESYKSILVKNSSYYKNALHIVSFLWILYWWM